MYPIAMCALAGLSTGLGAVLVIMAGGVSNEKMSFYQGFAAGVMLAVSRRDLLAESFAYYMPIYSTVGSTARIFSLFACGWIAGEGAAKFCDTIKLPRADSAKQEAYRMSVLTTLIMVLHNLPEGMLTIFTSAHSPGLGAHVTRAVALHNIPEGMAIAGPVLYVTNSKSRAFFQSLAAGLAELAGGLLSYFVLKSYINRAFLNGFMPVIAGVMCQTAATQLIPGRARLSNIKHTIYGIIAGAVVMLAGIFAF